METIGFPKTSVMNYHYSLRNNPEECSSQLLRGGSLKSRLLLLQLMNTPCVRLATHVHRAIPSLVLQKLSN